MLWVCHMVSSALFQTKIIVQCDDGDVKLLTEDTMGPLKVCVSKRWATVCSNGWSEADSSIVCRQLGYASGEKLSHSEISISCMVFAILYIGKSVLSVQL